MTEQLPLQGPTKSDCGCGCGVFGSLRSKPWRSNNVTCVRRGCPCRQCMGKASKTSGAKAQRTDRVMLNAPYASSLRTGHEEHHGGLLRWESKSGAQVRPMFTAFEKAEKQAEANRSFGDNRPFVMTARVQPHSKEAIMTFRVRNNDDLKTIVAALAEQLGLTS